jgi:hypothetical protein
MTVSCLFSKRSSCSSLRRIFPLSSTKPFANSDQLDPKENDARACVDAIRPGLQRLINQGARAEALVCSMTLTYAGR